MGKKHGEGPSIRPTLLDSRLKHHESSSELRLPETKEREDNAREIHRALAECRVPEKMGADGKSLFERKKQSERARAKLDPIEGQVGGNKTPPGKRVRTYPTNADGKETAIQTRIDFAKKRDGG